MSEHAVDCGTIDGYMCTCHHRAESGEHTTGCLLRLRRAEQGHAHGPCPCSCHSAESRESEEPKGCNCHDDYTCTKCW